MTLFKTLASAAIAVGAIAAATPASAVVTAFAAFTPIGTASNVYWKNNGPNGINNGTGGALYTIATGNSTTPGSRQVRFSFLDGGPTNVLAIFTLYASAPSGNPATLNGGFLDQAGITGSFSFIAVAGGANLLSGTFGNPMVSGDDADITGKRGSTSGSFLAATSTGTTINYTSDFENFVGVERSFSISLDSIFSTLQAVPSSGSPNFALRSFRATAGGTFSSAVPEPAVWGLMIVGFGMVGLQSRRRARHTAVAA